MSVNFDFEIIDRSGVAGISLIVARNEDAFRYLTDEVDMCIMDDGTADPPDTMARKQDKSSGAFSSASSRSPNNVGTIAVSVGRADSIMVRR